jgi:hypothetical protein
MGKLPAILLYDGDWIKDGVAGCSLAAQGLWLRMIFIGHNSERYGYLQVNGAPIPSESIARRCGCTLSEYEAYLAELELNGVPNRTPEGIIYSRRLVKDAQQRASAKARKRKERSESRSSHTSVTPLSEYVNVSEIPVLEVTTKLEAFDPEKYVRRIQAAWKWPHVDYSPLAENEILKCFEDESVTHSWPRIESAHYVTERVESIAKIVAGFEEDAQKFLPGLVKLMNTKAYRSPDKDWERKGPKKRGAAAPTGRPKW